MTRMASDDDQECGLVTRLSIPKVATSTLGNGLRIVSAEVTGVPVVAVNVCYQVGSRNEESGQTGLAHLFEHLMFRGSLHVAGGEHSAQLERTGAELNAMTSFDTTTYFETVPTHVFELALWLEADRMGGLLDTLEQQDLDSQRDVVKNERRQRYDNQPYGLAQEHLYRLLFPPGHRYRHLPIGSMADLSAATLDDVAAFFRAHYHAANAVLAVVGDVPAGRALAAAETFFGGISGRAAAQMAPAAPALRPLAHPVQESLEEDVPAPAIYAAWRLPADGTQECDAGAIAVQTLAGSAASRLSVELSRRRSLCRSVQGAVERLAAGNSVGLIVLRGRPGISAAEIEAVLDDQLARFAVEGPTENELESAVAQLESDWLRARGRHVGVASELARYALLFNDSDLAATAVDRWRALTADRVAAVAREWLQPRSRAQVTCLPAGGTGGLK